MTLFFALLLSVLLSCEAHAATLVWDVQAVPSPLTVERSTAMSGPFAMVATVPTGVTTYILTPGSWGWYRVTNSAGVSNVVQFSLDLYTGGLEDRVSALEAQLAALSVPVIVPPPVTTNLLTTRQIDSTHVELTCVGASIRTTGSGLRRIVECLP